MNKEYLEALERLAMPDELHIEECKRLGISLTDDYDLIKQALLELQSIKESNPSEALKCLEKLHFFVNGSRIDGDKYEQKLQELRTIEQALKSLEAIESANPSEALEELDEIIEYITEDKKVKYKATILFDCEIIKDALLKAQKQEKENTRAFGKDVINLNKTLKQAIDKPILYASRYGNKYIVPQKLFEEQEKVLKIIFEKNVDILDIRIYENYEHYCRAMKNSGLRKDWLLTQEEFNLLKEMTKLCLV